MAAPLDPAFALVALLLFFVLPGFTLSRALWPEWRLRGRDGVETMAKLATSSLVLSVALLILVGFVLGNAPGGLFQASPSDPLLELILAAMTAIFLVLAFLRGAFSEVPPSAPRFSTPPLAGEDDLPEVWREFEAMAREESKLRRRLRLETRENSPEADATRQALETLKARRREREAQREAELGA